MSLFERVFGSRQPNTIEIVFGKDRFPLDFSEGAIEDGTITVGILRSQCTKLTQMPAENIKLLFRGKNLTDDNIKIISVGMKSGSKVLCIASKPPGPVEKASGRSAGSVKQKSTSNGVKSPADQLTELLSMIRQDLEPSVQEFVSEVPSQPKQRREAHDRLAELLLQKLFALDGIVCGEDAAEAEKDDLRRKRKEGVNYTQGLLDSVDEAMRRDSDGTELAMPQTESEAGA